MRTLAITFLSLHFIYNAFAQEQISCIQTIEDAEKLYITGHISEIPKKLENCLNDSKNVLTKEELINATKIVIMSLLYEDKYAEADKWMKKILQRDKEHEFNPDIDKKELFFLKETFRYKPILKVGMKAIGNYPHIISYASFGLHNTNEIQKQIQPSFRAGINLFIKKDILKNITIGTGIGFMWQQFIISIPIDYKTDLTETDYILQTPLFLEYTISLKKIQPYINIGANLNYLFASTADLQNRAGGGKIQNIFGENLLKQEATLRKSINISIFAGIGIKIPINKQWHLFTEFQYQHMTTDFMNPSERYNNQTLIQKGSYVDDTFRVNLATLSFGAVASIYSIKKIK
ncbi:MAG: hypothetical protein QM536_00435 [Chitinophagaceae bacterium]|nr:hypothetical protein [Chitinophagaceae bacterium]